MQVSRIAVGIGIALLLAIVAAQISRAQITGGGGCATGLGNMEFGGGIYVPCSQGNSEVLTDPSNTELLSDPTNAYILTN